MKSKIRWTGCALLLALLALIWQPELARAGTRVMVGFDYGPVVAGYEHGPGYGYGYRPRPYYAEERWQYIPPPPPVYGYWRPHHRHHHSHHCRPYRCSYEHW